MEKSSEIDIYKIFKNYVYKFFYEYKNFTGFLDFSSLFFQIVTYD